MTTELYIGNVDINVPIDEARRAIEELGVDVLDLEVVGRHHHFQSFRLRVKKAHLETLKNPNAWPDGIVIRHFFRGRNNNNNNNNNRNSNNNNNDHRGNSNRGSDAGHNSNFPSDIGSGGSSSSTDGVAILS